MPSLKDTALLARHVYSKTEPLPYGWQILISSNQIDSIKSTSYFGYFSNVYLNKKQNEIVIVHRGTKLGVSNLEVTQDSTGNLTDDSLIATQCIPFETESAINFTNIIKKRYAGNYKYIQVGHSLGGFHAHICGYVCNMPVIAFDPPGWLQSLQRYETNNIDDEKLKKHYTFLSENNPVNQVNTHAGNIFQLTSVSSSILSAGGLATHPMNFILARISDRAGDPTQPNFDPAPFSRVFATPTSRGGVSQQIANTLSFRDALDIVNAPGNRRLYQATSRLSDFKYDQFDWVVSHINAGSIWAGHSMIVVEGVKFVETTEATGAKIQRPEIFIGYYHLRANKENQAWAVYDEYDYHRYARNYDKNKAKSWPCKPQEAMRLITNVKKQADLGEMIHYNFAGAYSILYASNGTHNCTSWAMEKLKLAGIEDPVVLVDYVKAKPTIHVASSVPQCRIM